MEPNVEWKLKKMPLEVLIRTIAVLATQVSLLAVAIAALSWGIASVLKGAAIPLVGKSVKDFGASLEIQAIHALIQIAIYSTITSLIAWVAVLLSSAA